jgi:protein phosphatase PTC7
MCESLVQKSLFHSSTSVAKVLLCYYASCTSPPHNRLFPSVLTSNLQAWAAAMSLAIASTAGLARLSPTSRRATAGLFLFALSASSVITPAQSIRTASLHTKRTSSPYAQPTCPLNRDSSPALVGLRAFHTTSHNWKSTPQFSYHVAASYSAKQDRFNAEMNTFTNPPYDPSEVTIASLAACKDTINKRHRAKSGQDAFFFSQIGTTKATTFGVADGVGSLAWTPRTFLTACAST